MWGCGFADSTQETQSSVLKSAQTGRGGACLSSQHLEGGGGVISSRSSSAEFQANLGYKDPISKPKIKYPVNVLILNMY